MRGHLARMFALGLGAAVVASVLFNVGMALQALEARRAPRSLALKGSLLLRLLRRPLWLLGSALGVIGIAPQVLALDEAPFVVVQTALAAGLLVLLAIAVSLLGERVGWEEVVGVTAMVAGIAFVAWGAPSHVETHRGGLVVLLVAAGLCAAALAPWLLPRKRRLDLPMVLVVGSGCGFAASNVATKLASDDLGLRHIPNGVAWGVVTVLAGIVAVVAQMTAFQVRAATVVIPVGFAVQTFLPIVLEPLFLRERLSSVAYDGAPLVAGLVLLLVGTLVVARNDTVAGLAAGAQS
jgi:drug/metabolite transporter (DMT)-like permease